MSSILAPEEGQEKRVLDLCTGTGKWWVLALPQLIQCLIVVIQGSGYGGTLPSCAISRNGYW